MPSPKGRLSIGSRTDDKQRRWNKHVDVFTGPRRDAGSTPATSTTNSCAPKTCKKSPAHILFITRLLSARCGGGGGDVRPPGQRPIPVIDAVLHNSWRESLKSPRTRVLGWKCPCNQAVAKIPPQGREKRFETVQNLVFMFGCPICRVLPTSPHYLSNPFTLGKYASPKRIIPSRVCPHCHR